MEKVHYSLAGHSNLTCGMTGVELEGHARADINLSEVLTKTLYP